MITHHSISAGLGKRKLQFVAALIIALLLHIALVTTLKLVPSFNMPDAPVKTLSVKLGNALSGSERILVKQALMPKSNAPAIEEFISSRTSAPEDDQQETKTTSKKLTIHGQANKQTKKAAKAVTKSKKKSSGQVAKRYVRQRVAKQPEVKAAGDVLGNNPESEQKRIARYTQTIALWMDKFKVYPEEARLAGMQGRAIIRIRIDRRGNIHYRILTQRTPYPMLDKAVMDMVRRANPVPPVPSDYPVQDAFLEFMIPVTFTLD